MTAGERGAPRVGYVCEGGAGIGWGHVGRGRALLEEAPPGSALVLGGGYDEIEAWSRESGVPLPLRRWSAADEPLNAARLHFDALVVDHYTLAPAWIEAAAAELPVFVVDDWMRCGQPLSATGLIGPNLGAVEGDWPLARVEHRLLGARYTVQRREVRAARRSGRTAGPLRRVLLTLGGSDPEGRTGAIAEMLCSLPWYEAGGALTVVLGASYAAERPWESWPAARRAGLEVVRQPADFVERCAAADLAVCGASTTSYELACLGTPFVPVALVDNQARIVREWRAAGVGAGTSVWDEGWMESLASAVTAQSEPDAREAAAAAASATVDGRGVFRVMQALEEACRHAEALR